MFIYCLKGIIFLNLGNLPWQNITASTDKEKTKLVG